MRIGHLVLLLGFRLAGSAPGAEVFVSPSGNDLTGNGTEASPWKTLAHAASVTDAASASTIRLAPGTYREIESSWIKPNVSVVGAGPGVTTVENAFVSGFDFMIRLDTALDGLPDGVLLDGNQSISGFHIVGVDHANRTRQSGIRIRGRRNVTVENMKFSSMGNGGIEIRAMDSVNQATGPAQYLTGIAVRNCTFENTAKDLHANVLIGGVEGAVLSGLRITEGRGVGIKAWVGGWLKNLRISGCTIDMLPPDRDRKATAGDDWPSIELTQVSDGSEICDNFLNHWISLAASFPGGGEWNLRVRNNHFVYAEGTHQPIQIGNHGTPRLEVAGNFFENIGSSHAVANWPFFGEISVASVHHNIFQGKGANSLAVLFQPNDAVPGFSNNGGNIGSIRVFNNTFINVSDAVLIQPLKGHSAQSVLIQNNLLADYTAFAEPYALISFNTAGGSVLAASVSNNLFHGIPEDRAVAGTVAVNSRFDDPQLLRTGALPHPFYQLTAASPAVDAGAQVEGFPAADGHPDLGAYELAGEAAVGDSDGDGQSNAAELVAGTSPSDPNDVFKVVQLQTAGGRVSMAWTSVAGKTYAIESTTCDFAAWTEQTRIQATGARTTGDLALPAGFPAAFFRVRVW